MCMYIYIYTYIYIYIYMYIYMHTYYILASFDVKAPTAPAALYSNNT
jgi:hypothetical protein